MYQQYALNLDIIIIIPTKLYTTKISYINLHTSETPLLPPSPRNGGDLGRCGAGRRLQPRGRAAAGRPGDRQHGQRLRGGAGRRPGGDVGRSGASVDGWWW